MTAATESISATPDFSFFDTPQPGVEMYDEKLLDRLDQMKKTRGNKYQPRTKHLRPDGWAKYTNRLFLETSPYLLQHAHNPVNWYPWGDEAFETAKRLNRPLFLSVGYSTCHWCHVMEEESFEDEEIAAYLNKNYIAVKVDREERPDVDAIYMSAVQALAGRGGWPMSVWLTHDRDPFYGGTYFPARDGDRGAGIGFLTILNRLNNLFIQDPEKIDKAGQQLTDAIQQMLTARPGNRLPDDKILGRAANYYRQNYDKKNGGLIGAPKFPSSLPARFLLRYYLKTGDKAMLEMAENSLIKMGSGGMYDQVGGGFHRYSVDDVWLVPHFEKMLYDNALLAVAYLEAYQVIKNPYLKKITIEILDYVRRDMTSPEGAFYSATDADSLTPGGHMEEGYYFTWTPEELKTVLGAEQAEIVKKYYAVENNPNFEGRFILHTPSSGEHVAAALNISTEELEKTINKSKELLYQARNERPLPLRDEKILTSWNALMISAFAKAGLILDKNEYTLQAVRAVKFIFNHLYVEGRLFRSYMDGTPKHHAFLDDYTFFIAALIDVFEATQDIAWLKKAVELDGVVEKYFEDRTSGGYFMTGTDHESLIAREKPYYDNAIPSGNSTAALYLLRLYSYTTDDRYRKRAESTLKSVSAHLSANPATLSEMLLAIDYYHDKPKEIIIIEDPNNKNKTNEYLAELNRQFLPNRILVVAAESQTEEYAKTIPLLSGKKMIDQNPTAYICENGTCSLPIHDPNQVAVQLQKKGTASEFSLKNKH
jgi:uncharacterized protein YyaL (SSP411 family)